MNRLLITFKRVTRRDSNGNPAAHVCESVNLVHPDDNRGHAAATGDSGHAAATGKNGVAVSVGIFGTAMAGPDGWIVLSAWRWNGDDYELVAVRSAKIGGAEGIKPNTPYRLSEKGEFIEA